MTNMFAVKQQAFEDKDVVEIYGRAKIIVIFSSCPAFICFLNRHNVLVLHLNLIILEGSVSVHITECSQFIKYIQCNLREKL